MLCKTWEMSDPLVLMAHIQEFFVCMWTFPQTPGQILMVSQVLGQIWKVRKLLGHGECFLEPVTETENVSEALGQKVNIVERCRILGQIEIALAYLGTYWNVH